MERKESVLIIYHADCIDGFTAAWACRKCLIDKTRFEPENITAIPAQYHLLQDIENVCKDYDTIYIVDFSLPLDQLRRIAKNGSSVFLIDHHKSAMEKHHPDLKDLSEEELKKVDWNNPYYRLCKLPYIDVDLYIFINLDECGASYVWKWFNFESESIPTLIEYVKDHDLWTHKYANTKYINKYLTVTAKTFENWDSIYTALDDTRASDIIVTKGKAMYAYHMMLVHQAAATAVPIEICGEEGLSCNCPSNLASDVGHILAEKSGTFGATWCQVLNDVKFSLRSSKNHGNYDVASLCKKMGGGGHHNAAGFVLAAPKRDEIFPDNDSPLGVEIWRI